MDRPRRSVRQKGHLQILEEPLAALQARQHSAPRRALIASSGVPEHSDRVSGSSPARADPAETDGDLDARITRDWGVAKAIRASIQARVDCARATERDADNAAAADRVIDAMRLAGSSAAPVSDSADCESVEREASSASASSLRESEELVPRRRPRRTLRCPNPLCLTSFFDAEALDAHLARGDGACPRTVGDVPSRTCQWCAKTLANTGNLVLHTSRCHRRPCTQQAIQPVGRYGFAPVATALERQTVLQCEFCGGPDDGITHQRECPGIAQLRQADQSHTQSDTAPARPTRTRAPTTDEETPEWSCVDSAFDAPTWAWLDALDVSTLPQTRAAKNITPWMLNVRDQFAKCLLRDRLITNPNDARGTKLLMLFPLLVLSYVRGGRNGQKAADFKRRAFAFSRGQWQQLLAVVTAKCDKQPRPEPSEAVILARVLKYIQLGDLRKARQALHPAASAPADDSTIAALAKLHPPAECPCPDDILSFMPPVEFLLDRALFDEVVETLPRGRAAGRSGWRYEDIQYLCTRGSVAADDLFKYFSRVATGCVTSDVASRLWGTATLIALLKSNSGIRPIAMGEVFRKLVSRVMLRQLGNAPASAVGAHQFGVARPNGLELVVSGVRIQLEDNPTHVVLGIDVSNAYNTFDRNLALRLMMDDPALAPCVPFLRMLYGHPSSLMYDVDEDDVHMIRSERGTQQGDCWSSLLFALVHTHAMDKVRARHPRMTALSYQDDTNVVGDIQTVAEVLPSVVEEFARVGLSVNTEKCHLYSRAAVPDELESAFAAVSVSHEGIVILGCPVGSDVFTRAKVADKLADYSRGMDMLPKLDHPQAAFKLLRDSFNQRAGYLSRTLPPDVCSALFKDFDDHIWRVACAILGLDKLGLAVDGPELFAARQQAFQPVRHAGLGLRSLYRVGPCAFLASMMDVASSLAGDDCVRAFFESVHSVDTPLRRALICARDALPPAAQFVCPPFAQFIAPGSKRTQAAVTKAVEQAVFRSFLNAHSPKDRARLLSASGPGAGAWLLAPPREQDLTLTQPQFTTAACRLFRLPQPAMLDALDTVRTTTPEAAHLVCNLGGTCGAEVDTTGDHVLQCRHHSTRHIRHKVIVDVLKTYVHQAGYAVTLENASVYPVRECDDGPRRMDIVGQDVMSATPALCIDVSIVDATLNRHFQRADGGSAVRPRYAAGGRAKEKHEKYKDTPPGHRLVPFVLEAHGALGAEAVECIKLLAKRIVARRAGGRRTFRAPVVLEALIKNELKQKLSIALQRCQAESLRQGALFMSGRAARAQRAVRVGS